MQPETDETVVRPKGSPHILPYDRTNPVMYDNDFANDYADWYLMVLAGAGEIEYKGISTSSSVAPFNNTLPRDDFIEKCVAERTRIVQLARHDGIRNVPEPVAGPLGYLAEPKSGKIEDTRPLDSAGSRAVVAEAKKASADKPLVLVMGGPLTVVADAYLLDPTIAESVVVAWTGGRYESMDDYNGWCDPWAAYIAIRKLRLVQFPIDPVLYPRMSRDWIRGNLPENESREHLLGLRLDVGNGADGDGDGMPAVSVARPDYVEAVRRVSFAGWKSSGEGHRVPTLKVDPNGRAIQVTRTNAVVASEDYRRAFTRPMVWSKVPGR
ncbi:nucleoside hydrolase [Singulisphaera sp. PoT]|uniref:nucleoside hydrolase n=1 Tax=Singulisphaera sp. PoT TaxID=3411797 RepID=UPI003BF613D5